MIVHFPIALLFTAAFVDTIGIILKGQDLWRRAAVGLYAAGTLGAVAAWFTGERAADSVFLPTDANALLTEHSDLGHYVLYFFAAYGLIRLVLFAMNMDTKTSTRAIAWLVGLVGIGLVWVTADHGAEMVYRYGVGVQAVPTETTVVAPTGSSADAGPVRNEMGGWTFKPVRSAAWMDSMTILGDVDGVTPSMMDGGDRGDVLALTMSGDPVMMLFDYPMTTVQLDAALNLDDFDGTVMFVTHVIDEDNYHFTSVSNSSMRQGKSENGDLILMADESYTPSGWHSYRAVADQTHFRGYSDQVLVVHGHGNDPGTGPVGVRLNGTGTVLIDFVQTASLRGEGRDMNMDVGEAEHDH